ncbi:ribonuclease Z [Marinobacter sp. JSM 1782161]|uniref:ribonuclease Z n=1 Tax=Marinobacter sp. JSM 1782161 TaxID=2685906 RepID=UPI0014030909|nr:ribonuclease Z [Marinobacter sp. JSM 1782161]
MQFTFLGTSAGTPTRQRNVTGLALQHGGPKGWYLVDCGEGTQHQLQRTHHSLVQLRAIFITHVHGDHSFGLPGLLASASMAGRTEPLPLIAPGPIKAYVETALAATDSHLGYDIEFIEVHADGFQWQDGHVHVTTAALSHRVPTVAYVFTERHLERQLLTDRLRADCIEAGPSWGELQRGRDVTLDDGRVLRSDDYTAIHRTPRRVVVGGDNDTPECLREACEGAQVLIHESTYTQAVSDHVGPKPQHSSAEQVARFAEAVGLPNLVLTHFSSRYQFNHPSAPLIDEIEQEARRFYSGNLNLARDFDRYRLERDGRLVAVTDEPAGEKSEPAAN